jgi:hypothetical protein
MLLLAELHELIEDLLRRPDAVGGVVLGVRGAGGVGVCGGLGCGGRRGHGGRWLGVRLVRRLGWIDRLGIRFGVVVEAHGVGIGRCGATSPRGEDELGRLFRCAGDKQHIAAGPIEELIEDLGDGSGTVAAEDSFVRYASGDGDSGDLRYLMEDLIEAGVISGDGELVVQVGDPGTVRRRDCRIRRWLWSGIDRLRDRRRLTEERRSEAEQQGESGWSLGAHALGSMVRRFDLLKVIGY